MPSHITVLFWNVNKLGRIDRIREFLLDAVRRFDINLLLFAECYNLPAITPAEGWHDGSLNSKIQLCYREDLRAFFEDINYKAEVMDGYIQGLGASGIRVHGNSPGGVMLHLPSLNLVLTAVHLRSRLSSDPVTQYLEAQTVAEKVRRFQKGAHYGVIVGDFNMQPHEPGLTHTHCFHSRTFPAQADETHWYNPFPALWNTWGYEAARQNGASFLANKGTHYFDTAPTDGPWHVFDYALFSPEVTQAGMLDLESLFFRNSELLFETRLGLEAATPLSDHAPVLFRLRRPDEALVR